MNTTAEKITVRATVQAPVEKVWELWTNPVDITNWSSPSPEWHTPRASHDLRPGGQFVYRMQSRDGSLGFDFGGTFDIVAPHHQLAYTLTDGRKVNILFTSQGRETEVTETFDAETENPLDMQRDGWQAILNSFKTYAEKTVLLAFSIRIQAGKRKVWDTMLHPDTYKVWSGAGWKDSHFEGSWAEGENIRFLSSSGEGTLVTLVSHKSYEMSHAKHIAVLLAGGGEDRDSELARGWIGSHERYTFTEENGITTLRVTITTTPAWADMFQDGWPRALSKLKEICEG